MKERKLTCIICPRGCSLVVTLADDGAVSDVVGNACRRGVDYAVAECTHPVRTVTSTVRCEDGSVVPVKTSAPIPKELVFAAMKEINSVCYSGEVSVGLAVIDNLLDTGASVVITGEKSK